MPRGQPDYGLYTQTPVASGIADPGEAAARLGGINVYDRRGWTVWMDDFEAPVLKWRRYIFAGGELPVLSTTEAWMGIQSIYLAVGAVAVDESSIERYFPLIRRGRVGAELFAYLWNGAGAALILFLRLYDGTDEYVAELWLDSQARTAAITTPAGLIPVATKCFPLAANHLFTPVKLVVDTDTDRYVRLMIGPDEIDLSAHALVRAGATDERFIYGNISLHGSPPDTSFAYVDNFILTQNEP